MHTNPQDKTSIDRLIPFTVGGISAVVSNILVFPADIVRTRLQIKGESGLKCSAFDMIKEVKNNEGFRGFYRGLDPALLRQISAGSISFGVFKTLAENIRQTHQRELTVFERTYICFTSGFLGAVLGTPWDVIITRIQADIALPVNQRRCYKGSYDAFYRITTEEGLFTLWKGSGISIFVCMLSTLGTLGTYDVIKRRLKLLTREKEDTKEIRLLASGISGALASLLGLPFNNVKMKLQKMKSNASGDLRYKGIFDCFKKSIKREGVTGLWVGWRVSFLSSAPGTISSLLMQDFLYDLVDVVKKRKY
jgi:solute carrier family 25 oxoglutarate transporter 11